jgi:hypothetical protein
MAPAGPLGKPRSIGISILLAIVTFGIYTFFWTFKTHEEMKLHTGRGLGGGIGVLIYFLASPATWFLVPNEIEKMYQLDGRQSPVQAIWGLWLLLPLLGAFIWFPRVQGALNNYWVAHGAVMP